jgi:hypothetical protein
VVAAYPNDASLLRLAVTPLMDMEEEWKYRIRPIDMEANLINETGPIVQITEKKKINTAIFRNRVSFPAYSWMFRRLSGR